MIFFINSEKYHSTAEELSCNDIIKMSGYPLYKNYKVIDEHSNYEYSGNDIITIKNNSSFMIQEII